AHSHITIISARRQPIMCAGVCWKPISSEARGTALRARSFRKAASRPAGADARQTYHISGSHLGARTSLRARSCSAGFLPRRQIASEHLFERFDLGPEAFAQPPVERGIERTELAAAAKAEAPYAGLAQHRDRDSGLVLLEPSPQPPGLFGEQRAPRA